MTIWVNLQDLTRIHSRGQNFILDIELEYRNAKVIGEWGHRLPI